MKDPNFDFSRLWPLIVGLFAAWLLRLVFNLQNYASNIFYVFSHILSLSSHSLQHPSSLAATAAHRKRSSSPLPTSTVAAHHRFSPRLTALVRPWSWLRFPFSSCPFSLHRFFCTRRRARSLRCAAQCTSLLCATRQLGWCPARPRIAPSIV